MRWFNVLAARLRALVGREAVLRDIDEEFRLHLDMETEANIERGMPPDEARLAALRSFGNQGSIKDVAYEVRGGGMLEALLQDVRFGARMLFKHKAFTVIAVVTLALGIGANTAIFSVVETVLLRSLPYRHADRVVLVWENNRLRSRPHNVVNPGNFLDWREQSKSFDEMAAFVDQRYNLTGAGEPEEIASQVATPNLFQLLGADAALGRTFTPEDVKAGREDIAVISHGLWQRRFGGAPDIIGKNITLNGTSVSVIGVMPPDFKWFIKENSLTGKPAEIWQPLVLSAQNAARRGRFMSTVARLAPGVPLKQAQVEMDAIAGRLEAQYPDANKGWGASVVPLRDQLAGEIKPALLVLLGAVGFVLLIACVNVANLLLARAATRHKEIAIRTALGAGRLRIIRQLLTESVLLALLGGAFGLLLSRWCVDALVALSPPNLIGAGQVGINLPVLGFTLAVSLLTGVVFGLVPALEVSRLNLSESLKESSRGNVGSPRGRRVRDALVVAEIGLAMVLLVGAGLMIRSFMQLQAVNPGFDAANLLTMRMLLPATKYPDDAKKVDFFRQVAAHTATLPGVRSATVISALPFADIGSATSFTIVGKPAPAPGQKTSTDVRVTDENYFRTMNIPVVRGRTFSEPEAVENRKVAVVNETFARKYFPGEDAIGKSVVVNMSDKPEPTEIIGIVGDAKYDKLEAEQRPMVYWTLPQLPASSMTLVMRTDADPQGLAAAAQREIQVIDKDQPVSEVRTMQSWLAESVARTRFGTLLLSFFAGVALLLAAVGIYGVMSYSVAQRRNEIGIRMALGAQAGDVLALVLRQGVTLALVGVGFGLVGAFALTRVMSSLLYGVSSTDPLTFTAIALLLTFVSLVACYIPARRATRIDPMIALRYE